MNEPGNKACSVTGVLPDAVERVAMAIDEADSATASTFDLARTAIAAMPGWQAIETAPKDGRNEILVWCTDTEEAFVAFRSHGDWQYARTPFGDRICCHPTHWMPLPPAPEVQS